VISRWTDLDAARVVDRPKALRKLPKIVVAVDVQNRLLGHSGATRVYGPQKGLGPQDFPLAERCLRRLAKLVRHPRRADLSLTPGSGAAGGLGFGFAAFLKGRLEPGFDLFAREVGLDRRLRVTDLVITGEGKIDGSTFMGKGAGQVARLAYGLGLPCVGFAGAMTPHTGSKHGFTEIHALIDLVSVRKAKAEPSLWLERLASRAANQWADR
jgi:glycerate kinase